MAARIPQNIAHQVELLFKETNQAVFTAALRATQGDRGLAEDLVQETYRQAASQWAAIASKDIAGQLAWLRCVVRRRAIDCWRIDSRMTVVPEVPERVSSSSAEEAVMLKDDLNRCWESIRGMPPMQARVLYLASHQEWTASEIADWLGIAPSTARVHLKNGRDTLRRALGRDTPFSADLDEDGLDGGEEAQ